MIAEQQPLANRVGDDMRGEAYGLKQGATKGDFTDGSNECLLGNVCPHLESSSSDHHLYLYFQHEGIDFEIETLPKLDAGGVRGNATSTEQPHLMYPSASNDADVPLTVCNTLSATYQPSTG
jgi:hypothetical protein